MRWLALWLQGSLPELLEVAERASCVVACWTNTMGLRLRVLLDLLPEAGRSLPALSCVHVLLDLCRENLGFAQVACFIFDVGWRGSHSLIRGGDLGCPHVLWMRPRGLEHIRVEHESLRKIVFHDRGVLAGEHVLRIVVYRCQTWVHWPRVDA